MSRSKPLLTRNIRELRTQIKFLFWSNSQTNWVILHFNYISVKKDENILLGYTMILQCIHFSVKILRIHYEKYSVCIAICLVLKIVEHLHVVFRENWSEKFFENFCTSVCRTGKRSAACIFLLLLFFPSSSSDLGAQ